MISTFTRGIARTEAATFTRPANTTAYAAGQVLADSTSAATLRQFRATKDLGAFGLLQKAEIVVAANQATKPDLQLWIFDAAPAIQNDAAAFAPSFAEMKTLVAVISFPVGSFVVANAAAGASGNVVCDAQNLAIPVNTVSGSDTLYGVLVVRNAYTPTSGEQYQIRLTFVE